MHVERQLVFNSLALMKEAALAGIGLAYLPADEVQSHVQGGRFITLLEDRSPFYPGYWLYFPSRRQPSAAFSLLVEALRYRG